MRVVDVAQIVAAFGGLAGFAALSMEVRWRRNGRKVPSTDLLASLGWLMEQLAELTAAGQRLAWFTDEPKKRETRLLAVLNTQIVDDKLNRLVGEARAGYRRAFASSSSVHQDRQMMHVEAARKACIEAIERAGELRRKYG
ncbi:hypothetical protein [Actinophytocola gossypii]|uniref:Uncharacterized protein n=1 Tax=Actinophytocola gossypii TaxID=2812003 RepID=A0ABT2JJ71_9PSEU|nr:hypothetical protein [Actinophytocola gossypii]MCT2587771.1 hypothetical protein [Actinophytocola gossypii]